MSSRLKRGCRRRSRIAGLLIVAAAGANAVGAATKTYQNSSDVVVPCGSTRTSVINVPDIGTITDLDVVNVTHKNPELGDVTIFLTDPTNTVTVQLKDSADGGTGDGIINVDFDDAAASSFPGFRADGSCIENATYRPFGSLADFNGLEVNGAWTLTVTEIDCADNQDCDCSIAEGPSCPRILDNWGLQITFTCDTVLVANQTLSTMITKQGCRLLKAGPDLTISTSLGATLVAGEAVELEDGVTVNTAASLTVGTCGLDLCTTGPALTASCSPCVTTVCAADPFCCATAWDGLCVQKVGTLCGLSCS